jgi:hypothetical protein
MWPDGGDGFIPMSFACMNPPANPTGRGEFGNGGGSNIKPWERRKPVVDILRAKNPCSDWFNQGTGSAANVMSQVAIVLYTSKDPYPDMPDANTGESPQTPIYVNSLGRFYTDRYNPALVGAYKAGSPGAQMVILLHELAHKVMPPGFVGDDADTPGASDKNTQSLLEHCKSAINDKAIDILEKESP